MRPGERRRRFTRRSPGGAGGRIKYPGLKSGVSGAGPSMRLEAALLEALEISRAMEDLGGVPDAVTLARESREELEERT